MSYSRLTQKRHSYHENGLVSSSDNLFQNLILLFTPIGIGNDSIKTQGLSPGSQGLSLGLTLGT